MRNVFQILRIGVALLIASVVITVGPISLIAGCGTLKDTGRTLNDAAGILCNLFAVEASETDSEALGGMTAGDYCAIHDNLRPFIDEALSAKQAAGRVSLSRQPSSADAGL